MSAEEKRPRWCRTTVAGRMTVIAGRNVGKDVLQIEIPADDEWSMGQDVTVMQTADATLLLEYAELVHPRPHRAIASKDCPLCALLSRLSQPPGKDGSR